MELRCRAVGAGKVLRQLRLGRTDLFLRKSGCGGRRVVIEVGTEEPALRLNQKRELKGQ